MKKVGLAFAVALLTIDGRSRTEGRRRLRLDRAGERVFNLTRQLKP